MLERGTPVRVMIVDDEQAFVGAVSALLETDDRVRVVASADNGADAVELAERDDVDVVLLDIAMPGVDGLETTRRLLRVKPSLRVIVVSGLVGNDVARDAVAAGATGFLLKGRLHDEIGSAIVAAVGPPPRDELLH